MRRNGGKRQDDQAGVDLSPLIDCVFLLLIFFLVTTMFKKFEHQIPIRMPDITSSLAEASQEDVFQVGMSAAGRFHLQDAVGDAQYPRFLGREENRLVEFKRRLQGIAGQHDTATGHLLEFRERGVGRLGTGQLVGAVDTDPPRQAGATDSGAESA